MKNTATPLTLYIDGYLHDVHEAEELMLDVFAYLFTKKPRIRDGGFKAYLYKAARHTALRHKSRRKPLFSLDALTNEPDGRLLAEEVIRTKERNRLLHFCMGEMNPDYREVLYLTYFEDMSYAQAAEITGKTVKQITNMVYRGKESLRRLLERGNHKCGVMRNGSRRQSPTKDYGKKRAGRNGGGSLPFPAPWRRALCCSSARPRHARHCRKHGPATTPALKRRPACMAAALHRIYRHRAFGVSSRVCVTVLCFRLHLMKEDQNNGDREFMELRTFAIAGHPLGFCLQRHSGYPTAGIGHCHIFC